jgi:predicted phosphodiesterase
MNTFDVGVAGDWHGSQMWGEVALDQFAAAGIYRVLHAGDFGFWPTQRGTDFIEGIQKTLEKNNQILYVTLGNHEDYVQVNTFVAHPDMSGFVYNPTFPNILVATRGARWEWEGVSFVSLGGAASIDFEGRTEGINWWKEERITLGDVYRTIQDGHADVMIAHDSATGVNLFGSHREERSNWSAKALEYADQSRAMMRQAVDGVKPDIFFHGHYHHYLDTQVHFNDGVEDYSYRNVSLGKDGQSNNMAVLNLVTKEVTMLSMPGE